MDADRNRVTVQEAARALGVTEQAVRKRIKRGSLDSDTEGNRVYVYLDAGYEPGQDAVTNPASDALISQMQARIDSLERSLEAEREANRENRRIIMAQAQNLAAIEAPDESVSPATHSADEEEPQAETQDSRGFAAWWRRLFGG